MSNLAPFAGKMGGQNFGRFLLSWVLGNKCRGSVVKKHNSIDFVRLVAIFGQQRPPFYSQESPVLKLSVLVCVKVCHISRVPQ